MAVIGSISVKKVPSPANIYELICFQPSAVELDPVDRIDRILLFFFIVLHIHPGFRPDGIDRPVGLAVHFLISQLYIKIIVSEFLFSTHFRLHDKPDIVILIILLYLLKFNIIDLPADPSDI